MTNTKNITVEQQEILSKILEATKNKTLLFVVVTGSHAYGLNTELSDIDMKFVYAEDVEFYLGLIKSQDSMPIDGNDVFGYELKKFLNLCVAENPTALEVLFSEERSILYCHDLFKPVIEYRHNFLSKNSYNTFINYAQTQIDKAKRLTKDVVLALEAYEEAVVKCGLSLNGESVKQVIRDEPVTYYDPEFGFCVDSTVGSLLDRYLKFKQDKFPYSNLGAKRRHHVKSYGYDTKNLAHAIRLGRTCVDILRTGDFRITRPDRDELLAIKNGRYSLDEVEEVFAAVKAGATKAHSVSVLPDKPDPVAASRLSALTLIWALTTG